MREGDLLSFQLLLPQSNNTLRTSVQIEAGCSSPQLHLLYLDGARRVYSMGSSQYSPARALSADLQTTLAANPTFVQACAQTPKTDWRLVKTNDSNWVLLDRNSVSTDNGETRFWAAFDNPAVLNDLPYNAPYAQKRERFAVSCATGTFKLLAGYDLDARNRVSDGRVDVSPTPQPIAGSNADYQALFALVCGNGQQTARLESFKPRLKASAKIALQSVQPEVLTAIGQLNLGQPVHSLKFVRTGGTATYKGKTSPAGEDRFISSDVPSGQLNITARGDGYESQEVSWRGLIPLVSKASFGGSGGMAQSSALSRLNFSGDWKTLPIGKTVSYTYNSATLNSIVGAYGDTPKTNRCKVERELKASELNLDLSGNAKALACTEESDKYQRVDHVYYLADYGYFFKAGTDKNSFFYSDYRIDTVE
ncbi:hypothetical protein [Pseudomonas frederiksbergensis]|nr:hypothetical protein [Pseudomonas frederiksbergensis]